MCGFHQLNSVETDSTFIYSGKLGESIVTVRKKDINWYIGGMTNWDEREVTLDFSFLGEGEKYQCTLFKDGVNASRQAEDYVKETLWWMPIPNCLSIWLLEEVLP